MLFFLSNINLEAVSDIFDIDKNIDIVILKIAMRENF